MLDSCYDKVSPYLPRCRGLVPGRSRVYNPRRRGNLFVPSATYILLLPSLLDQRNHPRQGVVLRPPTRMWLAPWSSVQVRSLRRLDKCLIGPSHVWLPATGVYPGSLGFNGLFPPVASLALCDALLSRGHTLQSPPSSFQGSHSAIPSIIHSGVTLCNPRGHTLQSPRMFHYVSFIQRMSLAGRPVGPSYPG